MATHSIILVRKNPIDREVWWATFHEVAKSWTLLSIQACMHTTVEVGETYHVRRKKKKKIKTSYFQNSEEGHI